MPVYITLNLSVYVTMNSATLILIWPHGLQYFRQGVIPNLITNTDTLFVDKIHRNQ